ncbi:MAG: type IV pilin [Candidatus Aenigmarchaeota archaeon]|nr:type IV pilin [Candidatus Aenigmarchaeota archaeon]
MKGVSEIVATLLMLMITLALAGTVYLFITSTYTQQAQGIDIVDAFCLREGSGADNSTITLKNIGGEPVTASSVVISQTSPSAATDLKWSSQTLQPGTNAIVYDQCEGVGSRSCIYRIVPPTGRAITAIVYCT